MLVEISRKRSSALIFSFISLFTAANAHASYSMLSMDCWRPVLALTGGLAITNDVGKSHTLPVIDSSTYHYSADHSWKTHSIFGGFLGAETQLYPSYALQAGLGFYQTSYVARGTLTQGVDPQSSDVYNYRYDIRARQLLLEGKFLSNWDCYHPYLSLGLGASFNRASSYETTVPPFLTFTPIFGNDTTTSFSWNVGIGVDADLNSNFRLGLGYRLNDFGKVQTGNGVIDTTPIPGKLSQSHLYVNELIAQLTFLMN